jgi:tetratricopeptide (TPR) repeat protein/CHAT domain-containing protein
LSGGLLLTLVLATCVAAGAEPPKKPLTAAQQERLKERDRLEAQARRLGQEGKLVEAVAAWEKKLAIEREVFGNVHDTVAQSLQELANMQEFREDFAAARKVRQEVLAIHTKLHGTKDWRVTDARLALEDSERLARMDAASRQRVGQALDLSTQVEQLRQQGRNREALGLARQVVTIQEQTLGKDHPHYATSLNNLANLYRAMGDYPKALPLLEEARTIRKKALGEDHPAYASSLNSLANLYQVTGAYPKALPLYEQARDLCKKCLGEDDPRYASVLHNLATLYRAIGDYQKALPPLEQARDLRKKHLGEHDPDFARSLNSLAMLYQDIGNYSKALLLYEKACDLFKKHLGEDHPDYAQSLNNLAVLYKDMGDYQKALPLLEQARDLRKKRPGEHHPDYAQSLNNLATLYQAMGDYSKALPLYEQACELRKKRLGEQHGDYVQSLNNLALLRQVMRDYQKALALYEQARDLCKKFLGEHHPDYPTILSNLAGLYHDVGDYQQAVSLIQQACDLYKNRLGEDHPHYARSLNNLAMLYRAMGDNPKALLLSKQACTINKKTLGESHPDYAHNLNILAYLLYADQGQPSEAATLFEKALTIEEEHFDKTFAALSDRQRLDFLDQLRDSLHGYLQVGSEGQTDPQRLYQHVLAWKGAITARQAEERLARDHPKLRPHFQKLQEVRAGLAHLIRNPPATAAQQPDWLKRFRELEAQKEELELRLARDSAAFRGFQELRHATARQVVQTLPPDTVLVDFVEYAHLFPPPRQQGKPDGEYRLLAFVLRSDRAPVCLALPSAEAIHEEVQAWRQVVGQPRASRQSAAEVARRVWQPLRPHLAGARVILIAPDGPVCALPFAALPGSRPGSYLVEEVALGYVSSGRHLLELAAAIDRPAAKGLLAVGGLAYGQPAVAAQQSDLPSYLRKPVWRDLPGTRLEVERIVQRYRKSLPVEGEPRLLDGNVADSACLKRELTPAAEAPRWRYLHLASHGYFEESPPQPVVRRPTGEGPTFGEWREHLTYTRNPLLLSGLVLSGANRAPENVLTAEEVAGLDLRGMELAVLSACETGLGRVAGGEGVLGLQRAFQIAEARTLVTSLWSVSDPATSVLMEEFYTNLWEKHLPKLEALRRAQVTVLRNPDRVHQRTRELREALAKRGMTEEALAQRGLGKEVVDLPDGGRIDTTDSQGSPSAWWAAFVLSGDTGDMTGVALEPLPEETAATDAEGKVAPVTESAAPGPVPLWLGVTGGAGVILLLGLAWLVLRRRA